MSRGGTYSIIAGACLALLAWGCEITPSYDQPRLARVDPTVQDPQISSSGFLVNEVLEIVAYMMPRMMANPFLNKAIEGGAGDVAKVPKIAVLPVKNNTRFALNKDVFMNRFRSELNKQANGKILFLARENIEDLKAERRLKGQQGVTTADYFLTGTVDGMTTPGSAGGGQESYLYSFRLIDTSNDVIIWEDNYTISKIAVERLINR